MGGTFILSLDCEGKWGVADALSPRWQRDLTEERLKAAYGAIAALLAKAGVAATFAFTELFLRSRDELLGLPVDEIAERLPFTRAAFQDLRHGSGEGWTGEWARDAIGPRHEIACHGVTHTPWTEMTPEQARYELSLVPIERGRTFIHPRNAIAHLGLLEEAGFVGYRLARPRSSRAASLASELNPFAAAEPPLAPARLQPIPAGYFINWLSGPRRLVPPWLTRRRARHVLDEAARTGGVAHFWTHPENVAAAPGTLRNLEAVVEEAAAMRKSGRIEIVTQIEFCRSLAS